MIPTKEQLTKYANLTIQKGVNIQKGKHYRSMHPLRRVSCALRC